jgi:hypothetical protein
MGKELILGRQKVQADQQPATVLARNAERYAASSSSEKALSPNIIARNSQNYKPTADGYVTSTELRKWCVHGSGLFQCTVPEFTGRIQVKPKISADTRTRDLQHIR